MNLLILSIAPVAIILGYIYYRDKYEKEPIWLMGLCVLGGALSVVPIIVLEIFLSIPLADISGYAHAGWNAFVVAAFSEEIFKFATVMLIAWRSRHFNEKMDGIVYAVSVSMGFALIENIQYVFSTGASTGLLRAVTAVPAHAIMGISMGFFLGRAKMNPINRTRNLFLALTTAILIHGFYDFILMSGMPYLMLVFVVYLVWMYRYGFRKIDETVEDSPFKRDDVD
ncbi:MAG: PrsW family glutamic-type intramembrane protease [Carboxylicivirga sp.]|jgi:RsiW-degrading membrane proteinase PrsW (M82 family)|nr:PrsW family glutamic-type intramembrane protease [Carboxylicivirga sp.]